MSKSILNQRMDKNDDIICKVVVLPYSNGHNFFWNTMF